MDLSIFLAKIYGIVFIAVGLGMLINSKYYRKAIDGMLKNYGVMYLGGAMALIIGYVIITYHNFWVKDWTVIITIFGWIAFIKGIMLLVFPKAMISLSLSMIKKMNLTIWSIITLVLGLVLGYYGFIA